MKPKGILSTPELAHLKSSDEKEFYNLAVNWFFERAKNFRGQHTALFFNGDEGIFEFTGMCCFQTLEQLERFHENVGRRDYHILLVEREQVLHFIFNGKYLLAKEVFSDHREVISYSYDQYLRDVIEGRKQLPPRTSAFREMIIGKALEQHAVAVAANKRKLAS